MINDDNKNDNNQEVKENAEAKQNDAAAEGEGEKKLGKVIPFESISATNEEVIKQVNSEIIKPAQVAANEAAESLKAAFEDFKKQLAPLGNSLKELSAALKAGSQAVEKKSDAPKAEAAQAEGTEEAAVNADDPQAENADADKKPDGAAVAAAREAGELVTLGIDKLKSQFSNAKFDLKGTVEREFANYADANLKEDEFTVDENGRRVVKVDGKFIQQHANEVIPALIRGTVGNFFKAVLGENLIKVAEDKAKADAAKAEGETAEAAEANDAEVKAQGLKADTEEEKTEHEPSKYRVEFDFSHALGDVIRNAQVSPAPATDADKHDRAVGREILIESAKIVEDSLNGKPIENVKERMEEAKERVDKSDSEKAPDEIQAVDEKHKKILELSKQFEKNMNPDK